MKYPKRYKIIDGYNTHIVASPSYLSLDTLTHTPNHIRYSPFAPLLWVRVQQLSPT
ncbi:uncharacterized protein CLUP02_05733 [Colletotrichum lupini]|uniref:Uncharacterized protein n=1 Tax=Colletotrichum lupini TaxID=145971 RepID=A0A9Q8SMS7_9PEZI|nr:uncharacterized protein CLUP02_05733 [Colletotrichum lupini]UQC80251.1 hypothetical protein CLUP02_05733 [Colletotrichum lupini]